MCETNPGFKIFCHLKNGVKMNVLFRGNQCNILEVGAESINIRTEQCK